MRCWLAALAGALTAQSANAAPASVAAYMGQPQAKADKRIAYGPSPAQVVDVFVPIGRGPHPVVVLIHGGCYLAEYEGLRQVSGIAADLKRRGYAVWNVEYRKLSEAGAGYPGTYLDVAAAVDRIPIEAARLRLDPDRVVALGHSAGGHLALWAAARHRLPRMRPLWSAMPTPIRAVVSVGGIGDLERHASVFARACGPSIAEVAPPATYAVTSPAELLPAGARVSMIHGEFDHVMPFHSGEAYVAKARAAGDAAEAIEIKGAGHFDPVMPGTAAWEVVAERVARELAGRE